MVKLILDCGSFFQPRARYVWETFLTYYKVKYEYVEPEELNPSGFSGENKNDLTIYCGPEAESRKVKGPALIFCHEKNTGDFFRRGGTPPAPAYVEGVPLLFVSGEGQPVSRRENRLLCRADILATAFFFLSAYQEYASPEQLNDQYGRYPFRASYQATHGFLEVPVVNHIFELIASWLKAMGQVVNKAALPGESPFALVLSHDVDRMSFYRSGWPFARLRGALAELVKYRRPAEAWSHFEGLFHNPHNTFSRMVRLHRRIGARDSFYFVFSRNRAPMDPDYLIDTRRMRRILRSLEKKGIDLGVHGSFNSISGKTLPEELEYFRSLVKSSIHGGRIHYLRFQVQKMFELFESAELNYDCSLGFSESPGFRTGMGLPHLMFDHERGKPFSTLEIPLNVMDTTLFDRRYLGLSPLQAFQKMEALLETAKSLGLCLSLLTHNDFYLYSNHKAVKLYRKLLRQARDQGALLTDSGTVYRWWKSLS